MSIERPRRVHLLHNNCLNSAYDFNLVRRGLEMGGFQVVESLSDADEVIFSGCSVRDIWVQEVAGHVRRVREAAPQMPITLTGCAAQTAADRIRELAPGVELHFESQSQLLARYAGIRLADVDRLLPQTQRTAFESRERPELSQLRSRVGPAKAEIVSELEKVDREFGTELESFYRRTTKGFIFYHEVTPVQFVAVTRSCPYRCSFCSIPAARGPFTSVPIEDILTKVRQAVDAGVSRMLLLGDEVGNYGADRAEGRGFADMLEAVLSVGPDVCVGIRYIEPKPFLKHASLIQRLCAEGRIDILYVSLQSGSREVLGRMNRSRALPRIVPMLKALRQTGVVLYGNWLGPVDIYVSQMKEAVNAMKAEKRLASLS